jgi:hypothetical protein
MTRREERRSKRGPAHAAPAVASVLLAVLGLAVPPAQALFEDLAPSPRARALGEATTATTDDVWAYYYNPAMLTLLEVPQVGAATLRPNGLDFNRLTGVAAATPLQGRRGTVAIGWRRYAVEFRDVELESENTISISHGFRLFDDASAQAAVGWTLNIFHAEFAPTVGLSGNGSDGRDPGSAWAVGIDIGALVAVYDRTRVGFFTRNLTSPEIGEDGEELDRQIVLGVAYEPYPGVTSAFDTRTTLDEEFRFSGGLEFEIVPALALRAGVESDPSKVTGGFGIHLPYVVLDYGFSTGGGVLDASHHFGLALRWDRTKSQEAGP